MSNVTNNAGLPGFPSDNTDPKKKLEKEYNLAAAKYIYNQFNSGYDIMGMQKRRDIKENRLYAEGNQDNFQYMESAGLKKDEQGNFISYSDIDYTPLGLCRNIVRSIMNKLRNIRFDPVVEAIDPLSQREKSEMIAEVQAKMMLAPAIKELLGTDITDGQYLPSTQQELELYKQEGIKLSDEIALEYYLKAIANDNKYEFYVEKACDHDLIIGDMAAQFTYYDENGFIKMEHVDIANLGIIGMAKKRDFSDAKGFCIVKNYSIEDLRLLCPDEKSDDEWDEIAKKINNYNMATPHTSNIQDRYLLWNNTFSDVAVCIWQTIDCYGYKEKEDEETGALKYKRVWGDWKPGPQSKSKKSVTKVHKWYMAWYIPQANEVLKFGPMPNMIRPKYKSKKNRALCPVTVVRASPHLVKNSASIIESIKKFENLAQIAYQKLQNEMANALPDGLEINVEAVAAGTDLVKVRDLQEAIDVGMQTNKWFVARKGGLDDINSGRAIQPISGGATKALADYIMIIRTAKEFMHALSGVPQVDVGESAPSGQGKAVTERVLMGGERILDDLAETKRMMNQLIGEKAINMIIDILNPANDMQNPYEDIISAAKTEVLKISSDLYARDMGFRVRQKMSESEFNKMMEDLVMLSTRYSQTSGAEGISPVEYIFIKQNFDENPKMAVLMMQSFAEKRKKEAAQKAQQDQMMNQQVQSMSAEQAHEQELQKMQAQMALEDKKSQNRINEITVQEQLKMKRDLAVEQLRGENKATTDITLRQMDHEQEEKMGAGKELVD